MNGTKSNLFLSQNWPEMKFLNLGHLDLKNVFNASIFGICSKNKSLYQILL